MKTYYIDLGNCEDGIVLSAKVTAASRQKAVAALRRMLEHRLGADGNCFIEVDGGRQDGTKEEVANVVIQLFLDRLCVDNVVEEAKA